MQDMACKAEDLSLIPGFGKSPGEGNGNPLQYVFLGELLDRGAWWATIHGVAKAKLDLALTTTPPPPPPIFSLFLAVQDIHCVWTYSLHVVGSFLSAVASLAPLL